MSANGLPEECLALLCRLADRLVDLQISDRDSPDYGALADPACNVLHTRAGEAVYPLAVAGRRAGREQALRASAALGDWLVSRQTEEGSWLETPGKWRGTTTDQMLALCAALPHLDAVLEEGAKERWRDAIARAADFLCRFIGEKTAHINYCATTAASLSLAWKLTGDGAHLDKARALARSITQRKINPEGFIFGEGHRERGILHGVDPGYNLDMTLWGLALYARVAGDEEVERKAAESLAVHLPLVYPDGSIDGSWGVRSNKWTTYGSKTAHGVQATFAMLARHDPRFVTAAARNLEYLRGMVREGMVGYGPHWWERQDTACIYPTFTRASNLALAIEHFDGGPAELPPLPCDEPFAKFFDSLDVAVVRTPGLMATVTAYGYKVPGLRTKSKYMARPTGGCISNLWFEGFGCLQAASQTRYRRWEPIHFPESGDLLPLGPRIEAMRGSRTYSSLNEFDGGIELDRASDGVRVSTSGVLRDDLGRSGGTRYVWRHAFGDRHVTKTAVVRAGMGRTSVRIVEPVIDAEGTTIARTDDRTVEIRGARGTFRLRIDEGDAEITLGGDLSRYWWPMPALQGFPITLRLKPLRFWREAAVRYTFEKTG